MATTPSPLPAAPPAPTPANIPLALEAISSGIPSLDPEVATAIAQSSSSPPQAQQTAQAAQGLIDATNLKNWLVGQNSTNQLNTWKQLDQPTQSSLKSLNYSPPHPARSIWGTITNDIGHAFSDTLNAAGAPYRAETHVERTLFSVANQSPNAPLQGGSWSDLFHALKTPSDWARSWNETSNGQAYILPQVQAQVAKKYDSQTFNAALALAKGKSAQDLITSAPQAQQQQISELLQSPTVRAATDELLAGHVTTGKMLANVLGLNPGPGNSMSSPGAALSGLLDATLMWNGDPTNIGLKSAEAYKLARHFVQTGEHVYQSFASDPAVKASFTDIAQRLQSINAATALSKLRAAGAPFAETLRSLPPADSGALGDLIDRYPSLERSLSYIDPVTGRAAGLLHENITSTQDLLDYAANDVNLQAILAGRPARLPGQIEGGLLPTLSHAGQIRLALKGSLQRSIDFLADRPAEIANLAPDDVIHSPLNATGPVNRIITGGGQFMRHLLTLTPNETFNIYDRGWFSALRNVSLQSLPRARTNALLTDYAAAATHGERVQILRGLVKEVMNATGSDDPAVSAWVDEATNPNNAESVLSHQQYSAGNMDLLPEPTGGQSPAALSHAQTRDEFTMPNYKNLYAQTKKLGIIKATDSALNNRMVDTFMNTIWKPLSLARFGFSLRVAGEEAFGLLLRNGPTALARSRLAASSVEREQGNDHLLASIWDSLTGHLPTSIQSTLKTPTDLVSHYLGDATNRAMSSVEGKLAGDRYVNAARLWSKHKGGDDIFARFVSSADRHGNAFDDSISTGKPTVPVWNRGRYVRARLTDTGAYKGYTPTATVYTHHWYKRLNEISTDRWLRPALLSSDLPYDTRLTQLADQLKIDPRWIANRRSFVQRDGLTLGNGATTDSLARDHAATIIDHVEYHLRDPSNTEINLGDHTLRQHLIDNRRPPTVPILDLVPDSTRPVSVSGPESVPVLSGGTGIWQHGINAMFHVIGKQIDWISRTPMFMDNFARGLDAFSQSGHLSTWQKMFGAQTLTKVVDKAGDPLRVYHGTPNAFEQFAENPKDLSQFNENVHGYYFSSDPHYASTYATAQYDPSHQLSPNVHIAYLDMRNPVYRGTYAEYITDAQIAEWKAAGHDGVIYQEGGKPAYVVFNRSQIHNTPDRLVTPGSDNAERVWVDAAADRALRDTLPYIHHPELRSQMSIITRNVAPFWFAQEQFLKRWARTFTFAPSTFRRAQLISQGVAHSGFTHTDPSTGQQYFVYPGAGAVQDTLARTLNHFSYFSGAYLPIEANLRGQVKMVSPGLERLGLPSLGPAVVIPMHAIADQFPELRPPIQSVEGPISSNSGYLASLVPTTASRLWTAFTGTPNNSAQYASAMMQAIQYLEATGHGLGEVATTSLGNVTSTDQAPTLHGAPGDYVTDAAGKVWVVQGDGQWRENDIPAEQAFLKRVQNWTRVFLLTRTLFGFNAPASPENLFDPSNVNEDLQTLMKSLPYEEAIASFMHTHPDATAYTVFQTIDKAGAPLPATTSALNFMDANSAFFKEYPLAGAFFIPASDTSGTFSTKAYQEQLAQQLRVKRTPTQFWQEIAYASASTEYFGAENAKNAYLNNNQSNYNAVQASWTDQSQQYMKANPLFAQQLATTGGTYTRAQIEDQLGTALKDPRLPENPQTEDIRTLYNAYITYQAIVAPYSQPNYGTISGNQKYQLELGFINQTQAFVQAHPDTLAVYNRLIRPDFSAILASQSGTIQ